MSEIRGSSAGRPKVPWLSKIGSNAQPLTSGQSVLRGAVAILVVVNPVTAVLFVVLRLTLGRTRLKPRWVLLLGTIGVVASFLTGRVAAYNRPWRELFDTVSGLDSIGSARSELATTAGQWPAWIVGQLPFAISVALLMVGLFMAYRSRYSATWRVKESTASAKTIRKAIAKAGTEGRVKEVTTVDDHVIPFGVDDGTADPVTIPASALRSHVIIGGPTGTGKSTTIMKLVDGVVGHPAVRGLRLPVVMLDMKGDDELREKFQELARVVGRRCYIVTVDGTGNTTYNPLGTGSPDQIKNKLIEAEASSADGGFSEPHFRRLGERFMLLACSVQHDLVARGATLADAGTTRLWRKDLNDLVRLMKAGVMGAQIDLLSPAIAARVKDYTTELANNKTLASDVYGIYNRYALIADGPAGRVLVDEPDSLDLYTAIMAGDLVLFSLDAGLDSATARQLGTLALQDLITVMSRLKTENYARDRFCLTIVDEFSALGGSSLTDLFARSRAAGGAVVLASQDLDADLEAVSPEFASAAKTNANIAVLHRQKGEAASGWAEAIGTRQTWTETLQITDDIDVYGTQSSASGVGSLRQTDEFIVHPNTLKTLARGVVILSIEHPQRTIRTVHVVPAKKRAPETPGKTPPAAKLAGSASLTAPLAPYTPSAASPPVDEEPMVRTPQTGLSGAKWSEAGRTVAAKVETPAAVEKPQVAPPLAWDEDDYDE